jgi:hypothetical protein
MIGAATPSQAASTLLLFGPQALSLNPDIIAWVRSVLTKNKNCTWISEAIVGLPEWLEEFSKAAPNFAIADGQQTLRDVVSWLKTGSPAPDPHCLPNIALSPLVVAIQLIQFTQYLDATRIAPRREAVVDSRFEHVTGLCTGLLSAFAIASSSSYDDLSRYGAVALRLAMLIGLVVDGRESAVGSRSKSFAVSWPNAETEAAVKQSIALQPEVSKIGALKLR